MSCRPSRTAAAARRIIGNGASLRTYPARRTPPPRNALSQSEALVMQTTRGSREISSTASIIVGWLAAITSEPSSRIASSGERSTRTTPRVRITQSVQRKPVAIPNCPRGSPMRRGRTW